MSFVGPRPEMNQYTLEYSENEKTILKVKPGLTDFSSLYFFNLSKFIDDDNPNLSFEEKVLPIKNKLRLEYVKRQSFIIDLKLIIKTIFYIISLKN